MSCEQNIQRSKSPHTATCLPRYSVEPEGDANQLCRHSYMHAVFCVGWYVHTQIKMEKQVDVGDFWNTL